MKGFYHIIYGRGGHLGHVTKISRTKFQCHYPRRLHIKFQLNTKLDLVNVDVHTNFGQTLSMCSQDNERKRKSDAIMGRYSV